MVRELLPTDPTSIGPYKLLGRLGQGGMGVVYLARSPGGRTVAVKVIQPQLAEEPGFKIRFAREVAAAKGVSGMFTALVVDSDTQGQHPWLATAYVAGPSLTEAVETQGPLPAESVLALAAGLAEGLAAIHAAGVVHRDLKPSNVLLAADGPRVIDFGISRAREASMLTQAGTVMGSPGYLSPEQAEGLPVGPASDIFSLGSVLVFAATGEGPFGAGLPAALMYRVVSKEPNLSRVPEAARPFIERCLDKDPAARPTPGGLLADLDAMGAGVGVVTPEWLPGPLTETLNRYVPTMQTPATPARPALRTDTTPAPGATVVQPAPTPVPVADPVPAAAEVAAVKEPGAPDTRADPAYAGAAEASAANDVVTPAPTARPADTFLVGAAGLAGLGLAGAALADNAPADDALADKALIGKAPAAGELGGQATVGMSTLPPLGQTPVARTPGTGIPVGSAPVATPPAGSGGAVGAAGGSATGGAAGNGGFGGSGPGGSGPGGSGSAGSGVNGGGNVTPLSRLSRRRLVIAAAAAAVIIAGIGAGLGLSGGGPGKPVSDPGQNPSVVSTNGSPSPSASKSPTHPPTHKPTPHPTKTKPTHHPKPTPTAARTTQRPVNPSPTAQETPEQQTTTPPPPAPTTAPPPPPHTTAPVHTTAPPPPHTTAPPAQSAGGSDVTPYGCGQSGAGSGATVEYYFENDSAAIAYAVGPGGTLPIEANGGQITVNTAVGAIWDVENSSGSCIGGFEINGSGTITVS